MLHSSFGVQPGVIEEEMTGILIASFCPERQIRELRPHLLQKDFTIDHIEGIGKISHENALAFTPFPALPPMPDGMDPDLGPAGRSDADLLWPK